LKLQKKSPSSTLAGTACLQKNLPLGDFFETSKKILPGSFWEAFGSSGSFWEASESFRKLLGSVWEASGKFWKLHRGSFSEAPWSFWSDF